MTIFLASDSSAWTNCLVEEQATRPVWHLSLLTALTAVDVRGDLPALFPPSLCHLETDLGQRNALQRLCAIPAGLCRLTSLTLVDTPTVSVSGRLQAAVIPHSVRHLTLLCDSDCYREPDRRSPPNLYWALKKEIQWLPALARLVLYDDRSLDFLIVDQAMPPQFWACIERLRRSRVAVCLRNARDSYVSLSDVQRIKRERT